MNSRRNPGASIYAVLSVLFLCACPHVGSGDEARREGPLLELRVETSSHALQAGDAVVCRVELENVADRPLTVMNRFVFPNHFLRFEIRDATGAMVPYVGGESAIVLKEEDVIVLRPGNWIGQTVQLYGTTEGVPHPFGQGYYDVGNPGRYVVEAVYNGCRDCSDNGSWEYEIRSQKVRFDVVGR